MSDLSNERLLFIPHEWEIGDQSGPRHTFHSLRVRGCLLEYEAYSLYARLREISYEAALQELLAVARRLQPTLILWQHPGHLDIPSEVLEPLRRNAYLVYHEADIYGRLQKRLPLGARRLAKASDVVFTVGMGTQAEIMRHAGAKSVGFVPSSVDLSRFGTEWEPTADRPFDVAMIGNRVSSRIPMMRGLPGARRREQLATSLGRMLGGRLALYGAGWDGFTGARGPIHFSHQERTARDAWLVASWDHFDRVPYFFSNRLPISLVSGVAHVTNSHPGYEHLFQDGRELFLTTSVEGSVERIADLLDGPRDHLNDVACRGELMARKYLASHVVFEEVLRMSVRHREGKKLPPPSAWTSNVDSHTD